MKTLKNITREVKGLSTFEKIQLVSMTTIGMILLNLVVAWAQNGFATYY